MISEKLTFIKKNTVGKIDFRIRKKVHRKKGFRKSGFGKMTGNHIDIVTWYIFLSTLEARKRRISRWVANLMKRDETNDILLSCYRTAEEVTSSLLS